VPAGNSCCVVRFIKQYFFVLGGELTRELCKKPSSETISNQEDGNVFRFSTQRPSGRQMTIEWSAPRALPPKIIPPHKEDVETQTEKETVEKKPKAKKKGKSVKIVNQAKKL